MISGYEHKSIPETPPPCRDVFRLSRGSLQDSLLAPIRAAAAIQKKNVSLAILRVLCALCGNDLDLLPAEAAARACDPAAFSPQYSPPNYRPRGSMPNTLRVLLWIAVSLLGAVALATIALHRGEQINALWLVVAAVSTYAVAYRFYSSFISAKVLALDPVRATPAERLDNCRRLHPHQQVGCLRIPLRRHRRPRPAGRPRARRSVRLFPRYPPDHRRCRPSEVACRISSSCCSRCAATANRSPRWPSPKLDASAGHHLRLPRRDQHHRDPARGGRAHCRQRAQVQSLGNLHHRHDHAHRRIDGRLSPAASPGRKSPRKLPSWDLFRASPPSLGDSGCREAPSWAAIFTLTAPTLGIPHHRLRVRRFRPARVAAAGAPRLPEHVCETRHHLSSRRSASWRCARLLCTCRL